MFESDEELSNKDNYGDLKLFASQYLSNANNPSKMNEVQLTDGTLVLQFKTDVKEQSLKEIRLMLQNKEKLERERLSGLKPALTPLASVYSPTKAVAYAQKHAKSYNSPEYKTFLADCTNFVSQCLIAGGKSKHKPSNYKTLGTIYETTSYWYSMHWTDISPYHRYGISSSFVSVDDFYTYWKTRGALVYSGLSKSQLQQQAKKGDIVQLKNGEGWYHSIIITSGTKGNWKYCGHTQDRKDYAVSELKGANQYRILRFA